MRNIRIYAMVSCCLEQICMYYYQDSKSMSSLASFPGDLVPYKMKPIRDKPIIQHVKMCRDYIINKTYYNFI